MSYFISLRENIADIWGQSPLLLQLIANCKPNYFLTENKGKVCLVTDQHEVIEEEDIDQRIIMEVKNISDIKRYYIGKLNFSNVEDLTKWRIFEYVLLFINRCAKLK